MAPSRAPHIALGRRARVARRSRAICSYVAGSGTFLVLGGANALSKRVLLTHVGAFLGVPVISVPAEMVNLRIEVRPHNDIVARTVGLGLPFI
jgi:hypothetical protein